jgi:hypothetical protein
MKRAGLYAMLSQIAHTIIMGLYLAAELYLFMKGEPHIHEETSTPYWDFSGFAGKVETFYEYGGLFMTLFELVYAILMVVLLNGLFKQYAPQKYMVLSIVFIFLPQSRFISIFCLRNRQPIDYNAYMRANAKRICVNANNIIINTAAATITRTATPTVATAEILTAIPTVSLRKNPKNRLANLAANRKTTSRLGNLAAVQRAKIPTIPMAFSIEKSAVDFETNNFIKNRAGNKRNLYFPSFFAPYNCKTVYTD